MTSVSGPRSTLITTMNPPCAVLEAIIGLGIPHQLFGVALSASGRAFKETDWVIPVRLAGDAWADVGPFATSGEVTAWIDRHFDSEALMPQPTAPTDQYVALLERWELHRAPGDAEVWTDFMGSIELRPATSGRYMVKVIQPPEDWVFIANPRTLDHILGLYFPDGPPAHG